MRMRSRMGVGGRGREVSDGEVAEVVAEVVRVRKETAVKAAVVVVVVVVVVMSGEEERERDPCCVDEDEVEPI